MYSLSKLNSVMIIKIVLLLLLVIHSYHSSGQKTLIIEGADTVNAEPITWLGINIPRSEPTIFTCRNNSITSINKIGYLLQSGDESPGKSNNNLDGQRVTGNKFVWNGPKSDTIITHGLFVGYNINSIVKYNYLERAPYGIIFKSGSEAGENMTFTSGGCAYNICKNEKFAVRMKGINGVKIYNNTFYNDDGSGWYFILITKNSDRLIPSPSTGTKIFNNIFYSTTPIPMIKMESGCLTDFKCDYNVYYCTSGEPKFMIDGVSTTWAEWRALGYDAHSLILDPNFINTTDLVPSTRLDYGINLGAEWQTGLSTTATWVVNTSPDTAIQNGIWQVGARIYRENIRITSIILSGSGGASTITTHKGTLQLNAAIMPSNVTNPVVSWFILNGTGQASIDSTGMVTALENGTVTVYATANDGSGIFGSLIITISNQITLVSAISVSGSDGASTITKDKGTLQLNAVVSPANATNKAVTWSILNETGQASIDSTGKVTAINNGTVTAWASAIDGSGVADTLVVAISNQITLSDVMNDTKNNTPMQLITTLNELKILFNDDFISYRADLFTANGVLVSTKFVESNSIKFDLTNLLSGIYLVKLSKGVDKKVVKVIKP